MSEQKTDGKKHKAPHQQKFPIYIEGDNGKLEAISVEAKKKKSSPDLPDDAELTSTAANDFVESLPHLQDNIAVIATQVKQALIDHQPEEWTVEFNIGIKAKGGIPFLAQGEANSALKISAKWKKSHRPDNGDWD